MNIIVPESKEVDYIVLDFRDGLDGKEMAFNPDLKDIDLSNWVVVVPKMDLITSTGDIDLNNYISVKRKLKNVLDDNHLKNMIKSLSYGFKFIKLPKNQSSVTVGAPLWQYSEQLITVIIKNPIKELGETRKFIDIVDSGICSLDYETRPEDYVEGNLIAKQKHSIATLKGINANRKVQMDGITK